MAKIDRKVLGKRVKDKITGFTGIATGITEWLNGCVRVNIQPEKLKDEKIIEPDWIDAQQVEIVKSAIAKDSKKRGGPSVNPVKYPKSDRLQ